MIPLPDKAGLRALRKQVFAVKTVRGTYCKLLDGAATRFGFKRWAQLSEAVMLADSRIEMALAVSHPGVCGYLDDGADFTEEDEARLRGKI